MHAAHLWYCTGPCACLAQVLLPKKATDAERLINWVERGVHEALECRYLESMTFGIASNEEQSEALSPSRPVSASSSFQSAHAKQRAAEGS